MQSLTRVLLHIYRFYVFQHPTLLVCDPDMVKAFTVKEFDKFADRFVSVLYMCVYDSCMYLFACMCIYIYLHMCEFVCEYVQA